MRIPMCEYCAWFIPPYIQVEIASMSDLNKLLVGPGIRQTKNREIVSHEIMLRLQDWTNEHDAEIELGSGGGGHFPIYLSNENGGLDDVLIAWQTFEKHTTVIYA